MSEATDDVLAKWSEGDLELFRIEGFRHTADSRYLGAVGISNLHSIFRAGFNGELSPDSRFMLKRHQGSGQPVRVFVVFRQFDSSRYQASPEDIVAGWVPAEQEGEAQGWVDQMNAQIRERRDKK